MKVRAASLETLWPEGPSYRFIRETSGCGETQRCTMRFTQRVCFRWDL